MMMPMEAPVERLPPGGVLGGILGGVLGGILGGALAGAVRKTCESTVTDKMDAGSPPPLKTLHVLSLFVTSCTVLSGGTASVAVTMTDAALTVHVAASAASPAARAILPQMFLRAAPVKSLTVPVIISDTCT
jgi:hypothetical protein